MSDKAMKLAKMLQTKFSPQMEDMYKAWAIQNNVPQSNDYDMRGFWFGKMIGDPEAQSSVNPADMQMHFSDKWKMPNHPSFSNESMYDVYGKAPKWVNQPMPYKKGTWGQYGNKGLMNLEIPLGDE